MLQGQYRATIACCSYHEASLTKSSGQTLVCLVELHKPGGLSLGLQAAIAGRVPLLFCFAPRTVEVPCSIEDRRTSAHHAVLTADVGYCVGNHESVAADHLQHPEHDIQQCWHGTIQNVTMGCQLQSAASETVKLVSAKDTHPKVLQGKT